MAWTKGKMDAYKSVFGELIINVDNVKRKSIPWPDWAVTTIVDTKEHWSTVSCHKTQLLAYSQLENLPQEHHEGLWGSQEFYRVISTVNSGRTPETDIFEGLR